MTCSKAGDKYPCCVSLLALHEENDRNFVYVVNEREGILGTEYYVEEITVSVADKNDNLAAIEGAVTMRAGSLIPPQRRSRRGMWCGCRMGLENICVLVIIEEKQDER